MYKFKPKYKRSIYNMVLDCLHNIDNVKKIKLCMHAYINILISSVEARLTVPFVFYQRAFESVFVSILYM